MGIGFIEFIGFDEFIGDSNLPPIPDNEDFLEWTAQDDTQKYLAWDDVTGTQILISWSE